LKWTAAVEDLGLQPGRRVVVLAPPGQGKTLLTRMTARSLARAARDHLLWQGAGLDDVPLPVVVPLDRLVPEGGAPSPASVLRAFRDTLAAALRGQGCAEVVARYLADHCHEERAWLVLDALDEVSESGKTTLRVLFGALKANAREWACRVLVTSRPGGYEGPRWPFDREYHLAPFAAEQVHAFVDNWFAAGPAQPAAEVRILDLLRHNPAIQKIGENPFLLTLLCAVAEREELPRDLTRARLYDRALRLALGGDRRADQWLPFLQGLAWDLFSRAPRRAEITGDQILSRLRDSDDRPPLAGDEDGLSAQEKAVRLSDELSRARLLVPAAGQRRFVFPHRSFAEYLTASFLARAAHARGWRRACVRWPGADRDSSAEDVVQEIAGQPDWEQVVQFLAGRLAEVDASGLAPLLELLLREDRDDYFRHRLGLAGQCLGELAPAVRARHPALVSRITGGVARRWWDHRRPMESYKPTRVDEAYRQWVEENEPGSEFQYTEAAVGHLARLLPLLARCGGVQGRPGEDPVIPFRQWVGQQLRNPRWQDFAIAAFEALGVEVIDPECLDEYLGLLARLLRDERRRVRWAACEAIGSIGHAVVSRAAPAIAAQVLQQLADLLDEADRANQTRSSTALDIWDALIDTLSGRERKVRWQHFRVPGFATDVEVTPDYLRRAAEFLRRRDQKLRDLRGWLDEMSRKRTASLPLLRWSNDDPIMPLFDPDPVVRRAAQLGVRPFRGPRGHEPAGQLLGQLASTDPAVRWVGVTRAAELGPGAARPEVLGRLVDLLRDERKGLRRQAVAALERIGAGRAGPDVLGALEDRVRDEGEDLTVRWAAGRALERLCGPNELGRFRELLGRQPRSRVGWAGGRFLHSARRAQSATRDILARWWGLAWSDPRAALRGLWSGFWGAPGRLAELGGRGVASARGWFAEDLVTPVALPHLRELGQAVVTSDYLAHIDKMLRSWWDGNAQWMAAELITGLGGAPSLPVRRFRSRLERLLRARDYAVRWAAVRALNSLQPPEVRLVFTSRWLRRAPRNLFTTAGWLKRHLGTWAAKSLDGKKRGPPSASE
jgi:HEAT repeat protein